MRKAVVILIAVVAVACGGGRQRPVQSASDHTDQSAGGEGAVFDISARELAEADRDTSIFVGKVRAGEVIQYSGWLRNTGAEPLVITSVETSCGCTSVEYERQPIAPGARGRLSFRFDSSGQMTGRQVKYIDIHTSAGKHTYTIMVNAEIEE
ncbi:MAG: DUF1573 domain-containing protein [Rikenellaceae bacterium]|jgi:hypothetical protein|nr:DUF1573 domain-containing protein [Rikenellaceae bacterium]